jgi:hypothetical protein
MILLESLMNLQSSTRYLNQSVTLKPLFHHIDRKYDAFDKDIAVLDVFFETTTVLQFSTRLG